HCTGTDWRAEPEQLHIELPPGQAVRQTVQAGCGAQVFPLPEVRLTYHTAAGDRAGRLDVQLPPYRELRLVRLGAAPRIDGELEPSEKAPLDWQVGLTEYHGSGPARIPTEFGAGLYDNALYVVVISFEPEMAHLRIRDPKAPTAHGSDDCAEVFLQREGEEAYYQFLLNAHGQRLDAKSGWNARALAWSGEWTSAVRRLADRWIAEFLIDLGMLERPLAAGDVLRLNVGRNSAVHGEYSQWSFTNRASSHVPQCFGTARVV
ncbi:MAG TPA: hypothetical protein VFK80_11580, partial [Limnochordia bacterium]|nr:hypothetical protein [Limnochordia bacterium]